jgi:hypothetical protein
MMKLKFDEQNVDESRTQTEERVQDKKEGVKCRKPQSEGLRPLPLMQKGPVEKLPLPIASALPELVRKV